MHLGTTKNLSRLALIGTLVILFLDLIFGVFGVRLHIKDGEKLTAILLWWTLLSVIWYSDETKRLRENSGKQIDLSLAPYLTIGVLPKQGNPTPLYIKNMGRGIASDIIIERITKDESGWRVKFDFENITNISAESTDGVKIPLEICYEPLEKQVETREVSIAPQKTDLMDPVSNDYVLDLQYRDIAGRVYKSKVRTDKLSNQKFKVIEYISPSFRYRIM